MPPNVFVHDVPSLWCEHICAVRYRAAMGSHRRPCLHAPACPVSQVPSDLYPDRGRRNSWTSSGRSSIPPIHCLVASRTSIAKDADCASQRRSAAGSKGRIMGWGATSWPPSEDPITSRARHTYRPIRECSEAAEVPVTTSASAAHPPRARATEIRASSTAGSSGHWTLVVKHTARATARVRR